MTEKPETAAPLFKPAEPQVSGRQFVEENAILTKLGLDKQQDAQGISLSPETVLLLRAVATKRGKVTGQKPSIGSIIDELVEQARGALEAEVRARKRKPASRKV